MIFWLTPVLAAAVNVPQVHRPALWRTFLIICALLAMALTGQPAHAATACNWSAPGSAPFAGRLDLAVENYRSIPAPVRKQLSAKISAHRYDDVVAITREGIQGEASYIGLRDMHWSRGLCKGFVTREAWADGATERGLVYCVDDHCLMVPSVCRNLSVVTRIPPEAPKTAIVVPGLGGSEGGAGSLGLPSALPADLDILPSPGAGPATIESPGAGFAGMALLPLYIGAAASPLSPVQVPAVVPAVPEVSTWALLALGLAALLVLGLKR